MSFELEIFLGFGAVSDASRTYTRVGRLVYKHEGGTPASVQDVTAFVERVAASDPSIVSPNLNYLRTHIRMVSEAFSVSCGKHRPFLGLGSAVPSRCN